MNTPVSEVQIPYARMPSAAGVLPLKTRLFRPTTPGPHPLLIWLHSGGFRSGSIDHKAHGLIGQAMAARGYASAFVQYRLRTPPQKVSVQSADLLADLAEDTRTYPFGINPFFTGAAAISAVEDCIVFFQWLDRFRDKYDLARHVLLGGSSAGAITVLNTLFLPPHLGIRLQAISSAFVYSGAFAYPSFYQPNQTRILALHNPDDPRVPVASMRHFAQRAARQCTYIEDPTHSHGDLRRGTETMQAAVDRIVAFDRSGTLDLPPPPATG